MTYVIVYRSSHRFASVKYLKKPCICHSQVTRFLIQYRAPKSTLCLVCVGALGADELKGENNEYWIPNCRLR